MATLGFPSNPSTGTVYTLGARTWVWTGQGWKIDSGTTALNTLTAVRVVVTTSTNSTSTDSGALVVAGGAGIGGDLYVGGDIVARKLTIEYTTITTTIVETDDIIKTSNSTNAATTDSGALTVVGGIGVGKDAWIGGGLYTNNLYVYSTNTTSRIYGPVVIQNETSSTTVNDGALQVYGGVGIRGDLHVGNIFSNGSQVLTSQDGTPNFVSKIIAGDDIAISSATGEVTVSDISTLQSVTNRGATTNNVVNILNYTVATSSDTGALVVAGGIGLLGDIYAAGRITAQNLKLQDSATITNNLTVGSIIITSNEDATTTGTGALRIAGGMSIAGNIFSTGNVYANGYLVNTGTFSGGTLSNKTKITNSETSISTDTGALQVIGGIGIGRDLYVGNSGSFDYITVRGTTTSTMYGPLQISDFLFVNSYYESTSPTSGALIVGGGAGVGRDLNVGGGLTVVGSVTASNFYGIFNGFVSATGTITTSTFTNAILGGQAGELLYQIGTDQTGFITTSTPGDILVSNGASAPKYQNTLTLSGTVPSNSTSTGTLVVVGGVGIGQDLYVGGTISGNYLQIAGFDQVSTVSGFLDVGIIRAIAPIDAFNASSTDTGALQVLGGAGIGGNLYVGQNLHVAGTAYLNNAEVLTTQSGLSSILGVSVVNQTLRLTTSTNSTSTDSGALIVAGGVGIARDLYVGGDLTLKGALVITTASIGTSAVTSITAGTDTVVSSNLGDITIWNISTLQSISDRGNSTTNAIAINNTTSSTSTETGALTIAGGVGIKGDAYVGGNISAKEYLGNKLTFTNGGVIDDRNSNISLKSGSTSTLIYTNILESTPTRTLVFGTDFAYGELKLTDDGAGNLYLLLLNGPNAAVVNTLRVGDHITIDANSQYATTIAGTLGPVPNDPYIGSYPNSVGYRLTDNFGITGQPDTNVAVVTFTDYAAWKFGADGNLTAPGKIAVQSTATSISTSSGALTVIGGVGIGGDVYVGGDLYQRGSQVVTFANTASLLASSAQYSSTSGYALNFNTGTLVSVAISADTSTFASTSGYALSFNTGTLVNISIYSSSSDYSAVAGTALALGTGTYTIVNSAVSTSTITGALTVVGGVGIGGDLYVGGTLYQNGQQILTTASVNQYANQTSITAGTDTAVNTSTGAITIWNTSTLQTVSDRGNSTTNAISITNAASASSTDTGALRVVGGAGIGGDLYVGGTLYQNGQQILTTASVNQYANQTSIIAGTDTAVSTSTGAITIWNTSTLQTVTDRGSTTTNAVRINNTTSSTSIVTGALTVAGGVGIGGALYVANTSYIGTGTILTSIDLQTVTHTATYITNDPGSVSGLATLANTNTIYGTYDFGTVSDTWTFNDYNTGTNVGYYSIHDASTSPAFIVYIGFSGITDFNRIVLNINYTQNSGHTQTIDLYNYVQSSWDTFTTYSGSPGWFEFILGTISAAPYISGGKVTARINHISFGNTSHRTWIDYIALEKSIQGGQGPRGATGATGAQGIQGLTTTTTSTFIFSNTLSSTATVTDNAVYIAGGLGVGKSLMVTGEAVFLNNVTFAGTSTFVYSTNTYYTDNLINVHVPNGAFTGTDHTWTVDDGKDLGFIFHYYKNQDKDAALVLANDSGNLEWYSDGLEVGGIFTGTEYGVFKTGGIVLTYTTASNSTDTGALVVAGGLGVGGQINASSIVAGGVRTTTGSNSPADPTVGDIWYNTNNDRMYRYTANGLVNFWLDYTGPVVQYPTIF